MKQPIRSSAAVLSAAISLAISTGVTAGNSNDTGKQVRADMPAADENAKARPDETHSNSTMLRTDYFVAIDDPNADDGNPGTEAKPFKSIEACFKAIADKLKPGDNVWIKNGEYRGVNLRLGDPGFKIPDGTSYARMISIMAYPGHRPLINQSSIVKDWKPFKDKIWVADYRVSSKQSFPVTFADGQVLRQIGGTVRNNPQHWLGKKGETLEDMEAGSFFYDEKQNRLYVWLQDSGDPNGHKMEAYGTGDPARDTGFLIRGKYIKVSGLTLRYGGMAVNGSYCFLEDIDQSWGAFEGCGVYGEFNTIANCKFNHNGNSGMVGSGRGHRILNCETSYNNFLNWSNGWGSGGVKFIPFCHDWVLKGHVSAYNNGDGIWFDWGMSGVTIEACRSYRNKGNGIHYEVGSRGVMKNNILYENGHRGIYLSNSSYCLIANNLCYRNGMSGIASIGVKRGGGTYFSRGTGIMPGGHNVVMGNILMDNCDAQGLLEMHGDWPLSLEFKKLFAATHAEFKTWSGRPELILPDPTGEPANSGCSSDYNIFYRSDKRKMKPEHLPFAVNFNCGYAYGLADWSKKTGFDEHSIFAEPKFKDLAQYDFHPAKDCPSQWFMKQYDVALAKDYDGVSRPYTPHANTAGPYAGDPQLYDKIMKDTKAGEYDVFPIKSGQPDWPTGRLILHSLCKAATVQEVAKFKMGVKINGIPFIAPGSPNEQLYFFGSNSTNFSFKPEAQVKELYFLFLAEGAEDKPLVRCTIHRGDGLKITFDWRADGKGTFKTVPTDNLQTKTAWKGNCTLYNKDGKYEEERSVFMTTWKNDNEWLPIIQIDFEHIEPSAKFALFGMTGKSLK